MRDSCLCDGASTRQLPHLRRRLTNPPSTALTGPTPTPRSHLQLLDTTPETGSYAAAGDSLLGRDVV